MEEYSQLSSLEGGAGVLVQPKKTEAGIPDFLIRKDGDIIGYIEAKTPDTNLLDVEDNDQLKSIMLLVITQRWNIQVVFQG